MAFPTGWSKKLQIKSDPTKVSGSSNLTDFPTLISDSNLTSAVYAGLNDGELNSCGLVDDANLSAYYRFESGALTTDSSGNSHTLTNNNSVTSVAAVHGNGADIEASSSQGFSISDHADFDLTTDWSMVGWFKPESQPGVGASLAMMAKYLPTGNNRSYAITYFNNSGTYQIRCVFSVDGSATSSYTVNQVLSNDTWYHIGITLSGGNLNFYVNGSLVGTSTSVTTPYIGTGDFEVGQFNAGSFWDGIIDDFAVFKRELNSQEIKSLYQGGSDLRITTDSAGTTEVPFEIVSLDTSAETCQIWAKVPTLSYTSSTSLYIWYGNASATPYAVGDTYGRNAVWSNYTATYHMETLTLDSSGNRTLINNGTITNETSSRFNQGADFGTSNSSKYFTNTTMPATGSAAFYVTQWIKTTQTSGGDTYSVGWDNGSSHSFQMQVNGVNANKIRAFWSGGSPSLYATTTMNDGEWHKIDFVYAGGAGGACALYIDGSLEDSDTATSNLSAEGSGTAEFIGRRSASAADYYSGTMDELRTIFGGTNPSADWIATEYNNQNAPSTFWTPVTNTGNMFLMF